MRTVLLALLCAAGCAPEPPAPLPSMDRVALEGVAGRVRGTIAGRRFRAADVRFRVIDQPHRRRIELLFADREIDRCGLPIERPRTSMLWARFSDRRELPPALYVRSDRRHPFEVHYERPEGRRFLALHRGVARIRIDRASATSIAGTMHVCFAEQSCASGAFEARPCASRIDGRAIREPPGLADDAIEALGASP